MSNHELEKCLADEKARHLHQRRAEFWSRVIARLPGVEAVFLTGSLAQGRSTAKSDIDFFIVARHGRIFTARFWVLAVLLICRRLAMNDESHAGRICPNHFVTASHLEIVERSQQFAYLYRRSRFLAGKVELWELFKKLNQPWMLAHGYGYDQVSDENIAIPSQKNSIGGNIFERGAYLIQHHKMRTNALQIPDEARIWLRRHEIRCHPDHAKTAGRYLDIISLEKTES